MFKLSKNGCSIKQGIQGVPDLCTLIVETILTMCSPDFWYKKAMTVSSNMDDNCCRVIKSSS